MRELLEIHNHLTGEVLACDPRGNSRLILRVPRVEGEPCDPSGGIIAVMLAPTLVGGESNDMVGEYA